MRHRGLGRQLRHAYRGGRGSCDAVRNAMRDAAPVAIPALDVPSPADMRRHRALPPVNALPPPADHPFATPPAPGHDARGRARRPVAAHAAAVRARSHQSVARSTRSDGRTLVDTRLRRRRHARALGAPLRARRWRRRRSARIIATHYHPDHLGNARVALGALRRAPLAMTHAEYLTAHAILGQSARLTASTDTCALFRRTASTTSTLAALAARGNAIARGVPQLPRTFRRLHRRRQPCDVGGRRVARHRRLRPLARARVAVLARAAAC